MPVLLLCLLLGAVGVRGQTPPPSPCPEVFQYWFQNGQWSGHVIVPVEDNVDQVTVVTSLFVADVVPPVPGGLRPTSDSNGGFRNSKVGWGNKPDVEYKLIFPVQSPIPLLDRITVNNRTICQGIPAMVRYVTESTCKTRLRGIAQSQSRGSFGLCDSHSTMWRPVGAHAPNPAPAQLIAQVTGQTEPTPPPTTPQPQGVRTSCPMSQQTQRTIYGKCGFPVETVRTGPYRTVFNGMQTERGDWPWLVALHYKKTMQLLCEATLVTVRHVITAAHCFDSTNQLGRLMGEADVLALVGKYDFAKWNESDVQCREVERITIFPEYLRMTLANDIAILLLKTRVKYNAYVIPICLFQLGMDPSRYTNGTVAGWGKMERGMTISNRPLFAKVPIVSQEACRTSHYEFQFYVSDRTMCAGDMKGTGPCSGDSGGGLVVPVPQPDGITRWFLRGIVSFNLKSGKQSICHLNEYSLYTDVSKYIEWIDLVIKGGMTRTTSESL